MFPPNEVVSEGVVGGKGGDDAIASTQGIEQLIRGDLPDLQFGQQRGIERVFKLIKENMLPGREIAVWREKVLLSLVYSETVIMIYFL